ncbi:hypothetical protein, partial [Acinetobacter baumannii]|uniref:hypothetical protein n=1 Tax=Acinetobacter baumannii TaxID=470 RepID=UPI003916FD3E
MRRLFLTALVLLAISNVQANDAGLINTAKTQIKDNIDDPFSAQFRKVRVVTNLDGKKSVCGEINYKNQYEPYRVCRRVNILRDYPDDKTKLYPR